MEIRRIEIPELESFFKKPEQEDIETRIKYFSKQYMEKHIHFVYVQEDKIVGVLALQKNHSRFYGKCFYLEYVSVDPLYQNRHIGTSLINEAVLFCKNSCAKLNPGFFSKEGAAYIRKSIATLAEKHNVEILANPF